MRASLACIVALGWLAGCAPVDDAPAPAPDEASPWVDLGEIAFREEDGILASPVIELSDGAAGFALFVETPGCVQVGRLYDAASEWVSELESGASCHACQTRMSAVAGSGMFVHMPDAPVEGLASLQLGQLECDTMARSWPGLDEPTSAHLWLRPLPEVRGPIAMPLRLRHGGYSNFADPPAEAALIDAVDALMAPADIQVEVSTSSVEPTLPLSTAWFEGDPSELEGVAGAPSSVVEVVFAGCIERVHPAVGSRTILDGLVPRVPSVGAAGASVWLRGRPCAANLERIEEWTTAVMARRVAHELGHYLGLYHEEETSGLDDGLPDTYGNTPMVLQPSAVSSPVFSPRQIDRMRLHAALLTAPLPTGF